LAAAYPGLALNFRDNPIDFKHQPSSALAFGDGRRGAQNRQPDHASRRKTTDLLQLHDEIATTNPALVGRRRAAPQAVKRAGC